MTDLNSPHLRDTAVADVRRAPKSGLPPSNLPQGPQRRSLGDHPSARPRAIRDRHRRTLNVIVAGTGLLVVFPLMILIAVSIKLTSRGPILHRQRRVGLDRRCVKHAASGDCRREQDHGEKWFTTYKFRTMTAPKEDPRQVRAQPSDPRVTHLGAILRRYRLDELPRLFNVLTGDLDMVGPRPERPKSSQRPLPAVDKLAERPQLRPGIAGWAQVEDGRIMARRLSAMMKKPSGH